MPEEWDITSAISLYNVDRWGSGYFTVNRDGNVEVVPRLNHETIDIMAVIRAAEERGLLFPLVVRFQDLLRHRVETVNQAFLSAIAEAGYTNVYRGVFPTKVSQLREVVEEILDAGSPFHFGLEAGSKPELLAALAVHSDPESPIICNGYKDSEFILNALLGRKLGKNIMMVVEKLEELQRILELAERLKVEPYVGLRVRLQTRGTGKWSTSGGENAKFGLSTAELLAASTLLKEKGLADSLKLVHFHVGSQIPDITTINAAVREAARFYAKLAKLGHGLGYLDVGGGLAVDYDGSRSNFDSSANYTLDEYARAVVYNIMEICDSEKVAQPVIISESGRAIVAHHSVLIVEAFGSIEKGLPAIGCGGGEDHQLVTDMREIHADLSETNRLENLHDARRLKEQAETMFDLGLIDLEIRAKVETLFWEIAERIVRLFQDAEHVPEEVTEMATALGDQYLCNFSVFQSLPDHWALGQLFPMMPLHRLDCRPDRSGTLADITCDSDGRVNKFIDLQDVKETLPLHALEPGKPYYLGLFLVGAYQDIMGDFHNLFGRVNEAHVFLDEDEEEGFYIEEVIHGNTIGEVLGMTQWDQKELVRKVKAQVDAAIKSDRLKPKEAMNLLSGYVNGLKGYTYLNLEAVK